MGMEAKTENIVLDEQFGMQNRLHYEDETEKAYIYATDDGLVIFVPKSRCKATQDGRYKIVPRNTWEWCVRKAKEAKEAQRTQNR